MKISKNKSRRGITLTETVIGIAIITLISAATLKLMLSQAKMRRKTVEVMEATAIAENALECYAHAGGENYLTLLKGVYGKDLTENNGTIKIANANVELIIEDGQFKVTVTHGSTKITRSIPE